MSKRHLEIDSDDGKFSWNGCGANKVVSCESAEETELYKDVLSFDDVKQRDVCTSFSEDYGSETDGKLLVEPFVLLDILDVTSMP